MFQNAQQQQKKQDTANFQNSLKSIYSIQQQPQLQYLIQILSQQYCLFNQQLDKDINQPTKLNQQQFQTIKVRCQKILIKNQRMLEKVFKIRAKFQQVTSFTNPLRQTNTHQRQILQKIRATESEIKRKIMELKQKRYSTSILDGSLTHRQSKSLQRQNISPLGTSLSQISKGVNLMQRKMIQSKYDLEVTVKTLQPHGLLNIKGN